MHDVAELSVTWVTCMQGFLQYSTRGEPGRLDVDLINEKLAVKGRLRLRHSMKPAEGYGVIFCFDGVICNLQPLKESAWESVAQARGAQPLRVADLGDESGANGT
jgi:hypothetical protein